jgi:hypothetical protein
MNEHFVCPLDCILINPWITKLRTPYFYCTGYSLYSYFLNYFLHIFLKVQFIVSMLLLFRLFIYHAAIIIIIIIIIQNLGWIWQELEPSQATGMALVCCFLGKFLGVVCHCFPLSLDVPTFAARCLHVPINTSAPSSKRWNYRVRNGWLILPVTQLPCNHRVL